jgi:hypothetical protein
LAGFRVAVIATRSRRAELVRNSSPRFYEDGLRIPYAPSAKPTLQDARRRLLHIYRDQYQSVRIEQRDNGALDLQNVIDVRRR